MNINLKFTNLEPTESLKAYAETKFKSIEKVLKTLDPTGAAILYIELAHATKHHQKGNIYYAEAKLDIPGKNFYVNEQENDLYAAIDVAKDTLARAVERFKDQKLDHDRE